MWFKMSFSSFLNSQHGSDCWLLCGLHVDATMLLDVLKSILCLVIAFVVVKKMVDENPMVCLTWANRRSGFFIFGEASEFIYRFFLLWTLFCLRLKLWMFVHTFVSKPYKEFIPFKWVET